MTVRTTSHPSVRPPSTPWPGEALTIVDPEADRAFSDAATREGLRPGDRWVGGYAAYEWKRSRHLFDRASAGIVDVRGARLLELGCFVGATAVVLAALGAQVTAVDASPRYLPVARQNARRYGLEARIDLACVPDFSALPHADASFDGVVCNSVLEYLPDKKLEGVLAEIDRVLRPGGFVAVLGAGNRLWPREPHTGRWFVNYLPHHLARRLAPASRTGEPGSVAAWRPRALSPFRLRSAFPGYEDLLLRDAGRALARAKARMGAPPLAVSGLRAFGGLARPFGLSAGMMLPSLALFLEKPGAPPSPRGRA